MSDGQDWYLLDENGVEVLGPYSMDQLRSMVGKGEVRLDRYIWSEKFDKDEWKRVVDLPEFQSAPKPSPRATVPRRHSKGFSAVLRQQEEKTQTQLSQALSHSKNPEYGIENVYRRFPRVPLNAEVVVRNDKEFRKAQCVDISEQGLFVTCEDLNVFEKGEEVVVIIRNAPIIGTVSVQSVIIRVLTTGKMQGYGVYFLRPNPRVKRLIANYVLKRLLGEFEEFSESPTGVEEAVTKTGDTEDDDSEQVA